MDSLPRVDDKLDRRSAVPLYFQLQEVIKGDIEVGLWQPGQDLPSESEFCSQYKVSRVVVRQALAVLEQDGQISRTQGRRSTVLPTKAESRAAGISRLLTSPRVGAGLTVLMASEQRASTRVGEQLQLPPHGVVLRMMTMLHINGGPVALFDSFFNAKLALPLAGVTPGPVPDDLLLTFPLGRSSVSIETSHCSKWEAEQLHIPERGAVFVTAAVETKASVRGRDRPLEVARGVYRADRVQFRLEFAGDEAQAEARWITSDAQTGSKARL